MARAIDPIFKDRLEQTVSMGMLDPLDVDECAENLQAITTLAQRGLITDRLATHIIDTMAKRKAEAWRAKHPEWTAGVV